MRLRWSSGYLWLPFFEFGHRPYYSFLFFLLFFLFYRPCQRNKSLKCCLLTSVFVVALYISIASLLRVISWWSGFTYFRVNESYYVHCNGQSRCLNKCQYTSKILKQAIHSKIHTILTMLWKYKPEDQKHWKVAELLKVYRHILGQWW